MVRIVNKEDPERRRRKNRGLQGRERRVKLKLVLFRLKIWHLVATNLVIFVRVSWANFVNFRLYSKGNIAQQETKQFFYFLVNIYFIVKSLVQMTQSIKYFTSMIVATFLLMRFAFSRLIVTRGTVSTCEPFLSRVSTMTRDWRAILI